MDHTEYTYVVRKFKEGEVHTENGVVGWKFDNGEFRPLMFDAVEELVMAGLIDETTATKTKLAHKEYQEHFLNEYINNYEGPSDEERFEARAAFGPGEEIVNVITGHKWRT